MGPSKAALERLLDTVQPNEVIHELTLIRLMTQVGHPGTRLRSYEVRPAVADLAGQGALATARLPKSKWIAVGDAGSTGTNAPLVKRLASLDAVARQEEPHLVRTGASILASSLADSGFASRPIGGRSLTNQGWVQVEISESARLMAAPLFHWGWTEPWDEAVWSVLSEAVRRKRHALIISAHPSPACLAFMKLVNCSAFPTYKYWLMNSRKTGRLRVGLRLTDVHKAESMAEAVVPLKTYIRTRLRERAELGSPPPEARDFATLGGLSTTSLPHKDRLSLFRDFVKTMPESPLRNRLISTAKYLINSLSRGSDAFFG